MASGKFEEGPKMPIAGAFRLCAVYSIRQNSIYVLARNPDMTGNNKFYQFSPEERKFTELMEMRGKAYAMYCTVTDNKYPYGPSFVAIGGHW